MRRALFIVVALALCVSLVGCAYSSATLMRARGDHVKVFGAWGYVDCTNAAVTLYRSTDAISYLKDKDAKYPKIPARPTVAENGMDITIGKEAAKAAAVSAIAGTKKDATPAEVKTAIDAAIDKVSVIAGE